MSLKPCPVLVAILACCTSLMAQQKEPFLGIWELNHGKSHFTLRDAPKSQTFVMVVEPGGFKSTRATLNENNTTSVETTITISTGIFTRRREATSASFPSSGLICTRSMRRPEGTGTDKSTSLPGE